MKKILKSTVLMSLIFTIVMVGFGSSITQASTYTLADVATHNTRADCWVIVNNNVYNLTSFITTHSGGASIIEAQCGKNGTASFVSGPHSASTLNAISSSLLGTLEKAAPLLTSVEIKPSSPSVKIGKMIQLTVKNKDQSGEKFTGAATTFNSNDSLIATVDSTTGLVTGVAIGSATITATSTYGDKVVTGTTIVKVVDKSIKNNNGNHWGQYKNWYKKWFKNHEDRKEIKNNKSEKSDHENDDNEVEVEDDD